MRQIPQRWETKHSYDRHKAMKIAGVNSAFNFEILHGYEDRRHLFNNSMQNILKLSKYPNGLQ